MLMSTAPVAYASSLQTELQKEAESNKEGSQTETSQPETSQSETPATETETSQPETKPELETRQTETAAAETETNACPVDTTTNEGRQGIRMHPKRMGHRTAIKKTMVRIKKTATRSQTVTARTIRIKKTMRMTRTVRKVTFRNRMMRANRWIILMRQPIMLPISLPETVFI